MCLGVPAEVLEIKRSETGLQVLKVRMGGIIKEVISAIPDLKPGEYVIVHAGVAISKINEDELGEILELFKQMSE